MDLWTEASADVEGEQRALRMAQAKVAVAGLWPFLALAQSERELEHRLALTSDHIANAVPVDLLHPIVESLREDYRMITAANVGDGGGSYAKNPAEAPSTQSNVATPGMAAPGAGDGTMHAPSAAGMPGSPETAVAGTPPPGAQSQQPAGIGSMKDAFGGKNPFMGGKNAEGEEEVDDEDDEGKPDWLKKKIKGEGAFFHQGRQVWIRIQADDTKEDFQPDAPTKRTDESDEDDDSDEAASWKDLGEKQGRRRTAVYWHTGERRWITAAIDEHDGGGNPYYFTGGPEAGPNTGSTNQFAPHPTGADPVDPLSQQYPLQPSPWTVPPGGEWKEEPMNFNPPGGGYHPYGKQSARGRHPFEATQVGESGKCVDCKQPVEYIKNSDGDRWWSHTGRYGAQADDDHTPWPDKHRNATRHHGEGVAGGPGPNPHFFDGGGEGVAGDQQSGFPQDMAGEDPDDWMNEAYGAQPMSAGQVDNGNHVAFWRRADASPDNPAPDSDKLMGTEFDSPQERQRWDNAEDPNAQQDSRASFSAARHGFYDPVDRGIRFTAAGDIEQGGSVVPAPEGAASPNSPVDQQDPDGPHPADNSTMPSDLMDKIMPQTTSPRQMPGGSMDPSMDGDDGGSDGGVGAEGDDNGMPFAASFQRRADGENRARPTMSNPYGTDDPFDAKTWDNASKQRPMVGLEHMNFNGPQNPNAREKIRTTTSPSSAPEEDDDEDEGRREAARVAAWVTRDLAGAR